MIREYRTDRIMISTRHDKDLNLTTNTPEEINCISGFETIIDESYIGDEFLNGEKIQREHLGERVFNLLDGFHRILFTINHLKLKMIKVHIYEKVLPSSTE